MVELQIECIDFLLGLHRRRWDGWIGYVDVWTVEGRHVVEVLLWLGNPLGRLHGHRCLWTRQVPHLFDLRSFAAELILSVSTSGYVACLSSAFKSVQSSLLARNCGGELHRPFWEHYCNRM